MPLARDALEDLVDRGSTQLRGFTQGKGIDAGRHLRAKLDAPKSRGLQAYHREHAQR